MLANMLRARGYTTGLVGKWHLGSNAPDHPMQRGFDEFFGFLEGVHPYYGEDISNPILRGFRLCPSAWCRSANPQLGSELAPAATSGSCAG